MSRLIRLTALAAVLVPLVAACSSSERPSSPSSLIARPLTHRFHRRQRPSATRPPRPRAASPTWSRPWRRATPTRSGPSTAAATRRPPACSRRTTESDPDNAWGHYMLGLSAWKTGDHTRALEAFDAALRLDPTHRKSLLNSARVLIETGRPQDALDRVERALAIEPLSSEGLRLAGRAHYELGQVDQAIDAYQRALAIDDRDVWAMNNLGYIYIQQGRTDSALPPLARAVELRRNVPVFQNNFATALERAGHFVSAREAYEAALAADSTYTKAAVGLERVRPTVRRPTARPWISRPCRKSSRRRWTSGGPYGDRGFDPAGRHGPVSRRWYETRRSELLPARKPRGMGAACPFGSCQSSSATGMSSPRSKRSRVQHHDVQRRAAPSHMISASSWPSAGECITP